MLSQEECCAVLAVVVGMCIGAGGDGLDEVHAHDTGYRAVCECIRDVAPIVGKSSAHVVIHPPAKTEDAHALPSLEAFVGVCLFPFEGDGVGRGRTCHDGWLVVLRCVYRCEESIWAREM